jgi:class 3 adenylate cyclase
MAVRPAIRYAVAPDGVHIAYTVAGEGPVTLAVVGDWLIHSEAFWSSPLWVPFLERMAGLGRFVAMDARGSGASDRVPIEGALTYEQAMDDLRVVFDDLGVERAFVLAHAQATPVAALFAATHPERTAGLVLVSPFASIIDRGDGVGFPPEMRDGILDMVVTGMGDPDSAWAHMAVPGDDPEAREIRASVAQQQRMGASPSTWRSLMEMTVDFDVRDVLRTVQVPALVLYGAHDDVVLPALSRHVAELLPDARVVEVPGEGHFFAARSDSGWAEAIEEFVTGAKPVVTVDRVLTTLLFTDIVGSTDRAVALGDTAWKELLGRHDTLAAAEVGRHRGRIVKSTGDGFLATFDGPARAIRCAQALSAAMAPLGLEMRAGLHTGEIEIVAGGSDVAGIAVHIAARVSALAAAGEILVSGAVPPLVTGSGLEFADRGEHELKGVPGRWPVLAVVP